MPELSQLVDVPLAPLAIRRGALIRAMQAHTAPQAGNPVAQADAYCARLASSRRGRLAHVASRHQAGKPQSEHGKEDQQQDHHELP